jgi:hypothetical protein
MKLASSLTINVSTWTYHKTYTEKSKRLHANGKKCNEIITKPIQQNEWRFFQTLKATWYFVKWILIFEMNLMVFFISMFSSLYSFMNRECKVALRTIIISSRTGLMVMGWEIWENYMAAWVKPLLYSAIFRLHCSQCSPQLLSYPCFMQGKKYFEFFCICIFMASEVILVHLKGDIFF